MKRILCPFHQERTPSCIIYAEHYHCYSCGAHGPLSAIGEQGTPLITQKEDLETEFEYIRSLPTQSIRGLHLPCDERGYYLLWPNALYYKKRYFDADNGSKYRNPSGHQKPLYIPCDTNGETPLIIVEGELNAASIHKACPEIAVCSPGAATDFYSSKYETYVDFYRKYANIILVVDNDAPGIKAGIELHSRLLDFTNNVQVSSWGKDANQVLQDVGAEGLRQQIAELGVLKGMPCDQDTMPPSRGSVT